MYSKGFFFLLFFCAQIVCAQNIQTLNINQHEVQKLAQLCKVWGFLKYYHPNVAKGKFDWDKELLRMIPLVEKTQNKQELNKVILDWLQFLGDFKPCNSCKKKRNIDYFNQNFDLSWLENHTLFEQELITQLKNIELNRFQGKHFFVRHKKAKNVLLINEPVYEDFLFLDRNHRLLSLFKYWNTVEYFFPYKYQMDQDWEEVLKEMIPKFTEANNDTDYHLAMLETVVKLDDTHAGFYTAQIHDFFGRKYVPVSFKRIENQVVVTQFYHDSLAKINDLRLGDIVLKIEGENINEIVNQRLKYVNGSNLNVKFRNFDYTVFNGNTDTTTLTIQRDNQVFDLKVARYDESYFKKKSFVKNSKYKILDNNMGYINMETLEMKDVKPMMEYFKSTNGIIIDLRNYPKFQPFLIARRFIKTQKTYAKLIYPDLKYPGKFIWKKEKTIPPLRKDYYPNKVILLVNEETQSAAEYSAMILQTGDHVITIGSQTAAANGDVSLIEFVGFKSYMSGLGVFYPDGSETQRVGLKIDVEVYPTMEGVSKGKDEVLEKAIEILLSKK